MVGENFEAGKVINSISRWIHLLSGRCVLVVCHDVEHAAPDCLFCFFWAWQPLEVLPQDDALGIIAELIAKQINAAHMGSVVLDTNADADGLI